MSAARLEKEKIDRWNMYKGRVNVASSAVIRATQFLVRPTERFPACNVHDIESLWHLWRDEEECFWRMTTHDKPPARSFPKLPDVDPQECCFRMWGLLIQVQVDGTHGSTNFLRETVLEIAANEKCKAHPATCPCHVPDNPWVYKEDVEALAPINPLHNPKCGCAGWQRCAQKMMANVAAAATRTQVTAGELLIRPEPKVESQATPYEYKHNVETCACGVCHKSRVDSGTEEAYAKRCQEASNAVINRLAKPQEAPTAQDLRLAHYGLPPLPPSPKSIGEAIANADAAIRMASAACGGAGADHPDFAKNLFAAMGTPHDSKCPHGMPIGGCMPCSH